MEDLLTTLPTAYNTEIEAKIEDLREQFKQEDITLDELNKAIKALRAKA